MCFLLKDVSSHHDMTTVRLEHTEAFMWSLMLVYSSECVAGVDYQHNYRQEGSGKFALKDRMHELQTWHL